MSLDLPVFDRKNLKRSFYNFLVFNMVIAAGSILFTKLSGSLNNYKILDTSITWIIIFALFGATLFFSSRNRKELSLILQIKDYEEQFARYENFYKKRLIWNAFSLVITAVFYIITNKNLFLYLLLMQLVMSLPLYPSKRWITTELKNPDIEFI